jgi:hypothetical protein
MAVSGAKRIIVPVRPKLTPRVEAVRELVACVRD